MTPELLSQCTESSLANATKFAVPLSVGMAFYSIDTPLRKAAFLAQIAHESGRLVYTTELWGPTAVQRRYEGRTDLGNNQPGDGSRFRGHGLIQITGRANHSAVTDRLRERFPNVPDFVVNPEALAEPEWASLSACDFWDRKKLNLFADQGMTRSITRSINGGENGLADREVLYENAKKFLT